MNMKNSIYPCVWCNNNAREMADFYCNIFKNTKIVEENPLVVMLNIGEEKVMLLNSGEHFTPNYSISLMYHSTENAEIEEVYKKLSENGTVLMEFGSYEWSEAYAWLNDKYGVSWQLISRKPEQIPQTLVPNMMYSGKYGKAREAAEFYVSVFPNSEMLGTMESPNGKMEHGEFMIDGNLIGILDQLEGYDVPFMKEFRWW